MCCPCCVGRQLWFGADSLNHNGNSSLRDLARQTVQLGMEIRSRPEPSPADFTMLSELEDDESEDCIMRDTGDEREEARVRGSGQQRPPEQQASVSFAPQMQINTGKPRVAAKQLAQLSGCKKSWQERAWVEVEPSVCCSETEHEFEFESSDEKTAPEELQSLCALSQPQSKSLSLGLAPGAAGASQPLQEAPRRLCVPK